MPVRFIRTYLEMIRFSHTLFAIPFALLALALAIHRLGKIRPLDVIGVVLCMVFARSSAMGFNRWADRDYDAQNPRTKARAIPAGLLSPAGVAGFVAGSSLLFLLSTACFYFASQNPWPMAFGIPLLTFLFGYSYAKRFTMLAHLWLGIALAVSPLAVWIALLPPGNWMPPLWLGLAIAFWVTGFDIIYACQDIDVDRELKLHSVPAYLGFHRALLIAACCHALTLVCLAGFGISTPELGRFYWLGFTLVAGLLGFEHWLARGRDQARINLAFFQVNAVISIGLFVVVLLDLLFPLPN